MTGAKELGQEVAEIPGNYSAARDSGSNVIMSGARALAPLVGDALEAGVGMAGAGEGMPAVVRAAESADIGKTGRAGMAAMSLMNPAHELSEARMEAPTHLTETGGVPTVPPKIEPSPSGGGASVGAAAVDKTPKVGALEGQKEWALAGNKAGQGLIRQQVGIANRDTEAGASALEKYQKPFNKLPQDQQWGLVAHVENYSKVDKDSIPAEVRPWVEEARKQYQVREDRLLDSYPTSSMGQNQGIVEDYFTHAGVWQNDQDARKFAEQWATGKQGSGVATKKRTFPTISDGLAAGLKIKQGLTPIDAQNQYMANMDRYIAMNEVVDTAVDQGHLAYFKPGAQEIPDGWAKINGRLGQKFTEGGAVVQQAYAPADFAKNYNMFVGRPVASKGLNALREMSNYITAMQLGFSAFHAATMSQEAIISDIARGVSQIASGSPLKGLASIARSPVAPVRLTMRGDKAMKIYLRHTPGSAKDAEIVDLLSQGGARMAKVDKSMTVSSAGSYVSALKHGKLGAQLRAQAQAIKDAPGLKGKVGQTTKAALTDIARVSETIMDPLFKYYIPRLKNGAMMDQMQSWMEANPLASHSDKVSAARKIADSVDNRMGEMVQDNIFWNSSVKQTAQIGLLSYSWMMGTLREGLGGIASIARHPLSSISMKGEHWNPAASYVIAFPIGVGMVNGITQYLFTGKPPQSPQDLMAPQTGGRTNVGTKAAPNWEPERAIMPGYLKEVITAYELYHGSKTPMQVVMGKTSGLLKLSLEIATNADWKNDPIRDINDPVPQQIWEQMDHTLKGMAPISSQQFLKKQNPQTNIGPIARGLGMHEAPLAIQDNDAYLRKTKDRAEAAQKRKLANDKKYGD